MLRIVLRPSRALTIVLITAHIASALLLTVLDVPLWAAAAMSVSLALSAVHSVSRYALLQSRASVVGVELREDGEAAVQTRDGEWHEVRVLGTTYVTPLLTVLNLREPGRVLTRHAVLVGDSADGEDLRSLRVRLRWGRSGAHW